LLGDVPGTRRGRGRLATKTGWRSAASWPRYAVRAVKLLRQAQKAGYFKAKANVEHMGKDKDLDPLRQREDFRKLVADLQKQRDQGKR
jgi:hypothetical protein